MLLNCGVGEDSWEPLGFPGDQTSPSSRKSVLNVHWKDWCWSWNSNPLATWCKKVTPWKRPWCWERSKAGEADDRGWDGRMASQTWWTWVWVSSVSWWWTGKPGMLQSMGSQRVGHDLVTELNWALFSGFEALHHFLKLPKFYHRCHRNNDLKYPMSQSSPSQCKFPVNNRLVTKSSILQIQGYSATVNT